MSWQEQILEINEYNRKYKNRLDGRENLKFSKCHNHEI